MEVSLISDKDIVVSVKILSSSVPHQPLYHPLNFRRLHSVQNCMQLRATSSRSAKAFCNENKSNILSIGMRLGQIYTDISVKPLKCGSFVLYPIHTSSVNFMPKFGLRFPDSGRTLVGFLAVQYEDVMDNIKSADLSGNCNSRSGRTAYQMILLWMMFLRERSQNGLKGNSLFFMIRWSLYSIACSSLKMSNS